jgi:hypothetical protein
MLIGDQYASGIAASIPIRKCSDPEDIHDLSLEGGS